MPNPVPPLDIANTPAHPIVKETPCNNAVAGVPPKLIVTFVSSVFVSAAGVMTGIPNDATVLVLTTPELLTNMSVAPDAVGILFIVTYPVVGAIAIHCVLPSFMNLYPPENRAVNWLLAVRVIDPP